MQHRQPSRLELILMTVSALMGIAAMVWQEMSPEQRDLTVLVIRVRARRMVHRMAYRSGHRAMGDELAGRDDQAAAGYGWALRLSQVRDKL